LTEVAVDGVTIIGNGTAADPLVAVGGGGGGLKIAIAFSTDHQNITGNQYQIGNVVWYNGNIYRCLAANDSIVPTNATYWTNLGPGFQTIERPSDWNATNGNNQILNKPTIPDPQVNSDWNSSIGLSEILNKPTIPTLTSDLTNDSGFITSADIPPQVNADWNASSGVEQILNKPTLATVATSGSYNDLSDQPTIPTLTSDLTNDSGFITSADVPTLTSELTNDSGFITSADIPTATSQLTNDSGFITSADVPTATSQLTNDSGFITIGDVPTQVNSDWNATSGFAQIFNKPTLAAVATSGSYNDLIDKPTLTNGTVTSVNLTMPSAFAVTGNPVTTSGTLAVAGAGLSSQYIRGDGQLANFPTSSGGGSSVSYYLNGSVAQGTLGGVAFKQMSGTPVIGSGTDFTINADGYIQSFITDASVPNQLAIPAGNWNFEMYFSSSSAGGTPRFYIELYKLSGVTLTLLASNSANPEYINNGTAIDLYTTSVAVPSTVLLAADRLAIRVYVIHSSKTITLHTEDNHLCEIITTFSTGLTALNGLTAQVQNFAVGTSGTDFAISSSTDTHTFNLPTASASNRGALSSTDWSTFNGKQDALVSGTNIKTINSTSLLGSGNIAVEPTIAAGTSSQYYRGDKTFQTLDKSAVGLSNVDNTSDANKPVSTVTQTALNLKQDTLVSGTSIKTINSTSLLGSGNISILVPTIYKSTTDSASFSSIINTIVYTQLIPANTFTVGDIIRLSYRTRKTGTLGNQGLRIYVNSTADLVGSPILVSVWITSISSNLLNQMLRHWVIKNATTNTETLSALNTSTVSDIASITGIVANAIDWTANRYIIFALQNTNATDINFGSMFLIEKL
jgi:hypothetical protein